MIEGLVRIPVEVDIASEFRYRKPIIKPGDLMIVITQSGETADTLAAQKEAKRLGARSSPSAMLSEARLQGRLMRFFIPIPALR